MKIITISGDLVGMIQDVLRDTRQDLLDRKISGNKQSRLQTVNEVEQLLRDQCISSLQQVYVVAWEFDHGGGFDWCEEKVHAESQWEAEKENAKIFAKDNWTNYYFEVSRELLGNPEDDVGVTEEISSRLYDLCLQAERVYKYDPQVDAPVEPTPRTGTGVVLEHDESGRPFVVAVEVPQGQLWLDEYDKRSKQEGWAMFDCDRELRIQKIDMPEEVSEEIGAPVPEISSDTQAINLVVQKALAGSQMHALALYLHGRDMPPLNLPWYIPQALVEKPPAEETPHSLRNDRGWMKGSPLHGEPEPIKQSGSANLRCGTGLPKTEGNELIEFGQAWTSAHDDLAAKDGWELNTVDDDLWQIQRCEVSHSLRNDRDAVNLVQRLSELPQAGNKLYRLALFFHGQVVRKTYQVPPELRGL